MASGYIRFIFFSAILISFGCFVKNHAAPADSSHAKELHRTLNWTGTACSLGGLLHNLQNLNMKLWHRGGIAFMVDGGTLLAKGFTLLLETGFAFFILILWNKLLLRLRIKADDQVRYYLKERTIHTKFLMLNARRTIKKKSAKAERSGGRSAENTSAVPKKMAVLIGVMFPESRKGKLSNVLDEVEGMRRILMEKFDFLDQNIIMLLDINKYTHPTKAEIQRQLTLLVEEANVQDILFVYFAGHCNGYDTDKVGLLTSDCKFITDYFLSGKMMPRVPREATLTVMINTCFAGSFMKGAKETENVIIFPIAGEYQKTTDGLVYFGVLERVLKETTEKTTNLKIYRKIKKGMRDSGILKEKVLPFYCPQGKKNANFLRW